MLAVGIKTISSLGLLKEESVPLFKGSTPYALRLPPWLDNLIFKELGAIYAPQDRDLVVLEWDEIGIRKYLGTYFPRSFVESFYIFSGLFAEQDAEYKCRRELSLFDFGCGTGGQIVGLTLAVADIMPNIKKISVTGLDGNRHALRVLERIMKKTAAVTGVEIELKFIPDPIDDYYDLKIIDKVVNRKFDIIIAFKAICEFIACEQFNERNPYEYFFNTFISKLENNGKILIGDLSFRDKKSSEWLPKILDKGASSCTKAILINENDKFNGKFYDQFYTFHSKVNQDKSKLVWRLYSKKV